MHTGCQIVRALLVLFVIIVGGGCQTRPRCYPVPRAFFVSEVAGKWIGFTATDTDLYRLELRADNTGILTKAYTGATNLETMRFDISRWDIATNNILACAFSQFEVEDSLKMTWPVKMTCQVTGTRIEALLRNGEGGWKEAIVFWREKELDDKLRVIRQRSRQINKDSVGWSRGSRWLY